MPYNEEIDARIQKIVASWKKTDRKKMFGGICYLLNGAMVSGVYKDFLILRLGPDGAAEALKSPHVKPFDITGRAMKGWVMVEEGGFAGDEELSELLDRARAFVETLPPK